MSRIVADELKSISIYNLKKWGLLHVDEVTFMQTGRMEWFRTRYTEKILTGSATYQIDYEKGIPLRIWISYEIQSINVSRNYPISLVSTACNFGNLRYWFICGVSKKGRYCGRRVAKLYLFGSYFCCRHCLNLTYDINNESKKSREFSALLGGKRVTALEDHLNKTHRFVYAGRLTKKAKRWRELRFEQDIKASRWLISNEGKFGI